MAVSLPAVLGDSRVSYQRDPGTPFISYPARMYASRLAVLAAITATVVWGLKAVAIGTAGGLDKSPLESPLFILGLAAIVVAFASLGVALTGRRSLSYKVLGASAGVVVGVALSALASAVAAAVVPDSAGWVQEEAGLWVSALLAVGVTAYWHNRGAVHTGAERT